MNQIKNVCVYSASSTKIAPVYFAVAEELGQLLALRGINLINGAGSIGLMAATSNACLAAGGTVTGVIPRFMVEQGWQHKSLTQLIETETMHERKQIMAEMSDGVIALPGGCGTMEELLEIITWKQLGIYLNPIIILNINGLSRFSKYLLPATWYTAVCGQPMRAVSNVAVPELTIAACALSSRVYVSLVSSSPCK